LSLLVEHYDLSLYILAAALATLTLEESLVAFLVR
jgi:hypothetical protein